MVWQGTHEKCRCMGRNSSGRPWRLSPVPGFTIFYDHRPILYERGIIWMAGRDPEGAVPLTHITVVENTLHIAYVSTDMWLGLQWRAAKPAVRTTRSNKWIMSPHVGFEALQSWDCEECDLLSCNALQFGRCTPTFRRDIPPSFQDQRVCLTRNWQ